MLPVTFGVAGFFVLKLRDHYPTLDALCEDLDADKAALCARLASIGYQYDPLQNQFKAC